MKRIHSQRLARDFQQIQKRTARKLYNEGKYIYLQSSNMQFDSMWQRPCIVSKKESDMDFDALCNEFEYYNCDKERGKWIRFYVQC